MPNKSLLTVKTSASLVWMNGLIKDTWHGLFLAGANKTVSSNAITVAPADGEGRYIVTASGGSDTLNTINGMADGDVVMLQAASGKTILIGTSGNIVPPGGAAFILPQTDFITFIKLSSTIVPIGPLSLKRVVVIPVLDNLTPWTVKDGVGDIYTPIPQEFNGWNIIAAHGSVGVPSSSGLPTMQIARYRGSWVDVLDPSYKITFDVSEYTSYSAATQPVINTANDDLATGDLIRVDHDVTGTGTKGCNAILTFALP